MKTKASLSVLFVTLCVAQVISACGASASTPLAEPTDLPTALPTAEPTATLVPEPTATPAPAVEFVGSVVGNPNPLSKPIAVALDAQDNLYVLEAGNNRVQVFDTNGQFVRMWGSLGDGDGQFNLNHPNGAGLLAEGYPAGDVLGDIAIDSIGNVYVLDSFNRRVQKFTSDGTFLATWGTEAITGTAPDGQFRFPAGIAVDMEGNVYVSDGGRPDIQKFDAEGNFLAKIGELGQSDGQFNAGIIGSLIVSNEGDVFVADFWSDRVQVFGSDGHFLRKWNRLGVWGIALDSEGNIYSTLSVGDAIVKFDSQGQTLFKWGERGGGDGQFRRPMDVAIDSKGLIYIADYDNNRIQILHEP
jgi:DNA-binding beta-propeller fold protein YncE